jgi:hypothetical protein
VTSGVPAVAGPTAPAAQGGARVVLPGQSPEGTYVLSVLVKRTYRIVPGAACVRAVADRALVPGDEFWDSPMNSSVRQESDFVPFKVATDVVLDGTAHAPGGGATRACVVTLQVGDRRKSIQVIGDRLAKYAGGAAPAITEPAPFTTMELRYERAYGGTDVYSDPKVLYPYPRNPLGRGFVVANTPKSVHDLPLPNLEDAEAPLASLPLCVGEYDRWTACPRPAGFGWFPKVWLPRAELAGILPLDRPIEQELRRAYAQLLPEDQREPYLTHGIRDMDFRFFNGASDRLALPFLRGGETIVTENLSPDGRRTFQLPSDVPRIGLDLGEGVHEPVVALHTVMIRMDDGELDLVWRGAVPYRGPDWLPEMRRMEVSIA